MSLVEDSLTHRKYALKKIICHGPEDQRLAVKEIEYHSMVKHPNVIELIDSTHQGTADPVVNATSEVLLVLPYYHVCQFNIFRIFLIIFNKKYKYLTSERNFSSRIRETCKNT